MKHFVLFVLVTFSAGTLSSQNTTFGNSYMKGVDTAEVRKHPPTAPVYYKDAQQVGATDKDAMYMRKYAPVNSSNAAGEPLTAPVPAHPQADYPVPRVVKVADSKESFPPTPPVSKPKN